MTALIPFKPLVKSGQTVSKPLPIRIYRPVYWWERFRLLIQMNNSGPRTPCLILWLAAWTLEITSKTHDLWMTNSNILQPVRLPLRWWLGGPNGSYIITPRASWPRSSEEVRTRAGRPQTEKDGAFSLWYAFCVSWMCTWLGSGGWFNCGENLSHRSNGSNAITPFREAS